MMTASSFRLLPFDRGDGAGNMAADEILLASAAAHSAPAVRFYLWTEPTVSLGYFQRDNSRRAFPELASLPRVRRPSGGDTLVHHHELTYALALPTESPWREGEPWPSRMHRIVARALTEWGIEAQLHQAAGKSRATGTMCFHHFTEGDLMVRGSKIVGSAQRKQRGALLQHGGILLAASPHTPTLPGILELTGVCVAAAELMAACLRGLREETGWEPVAVDWTEAERAHRDELAATKYSQDWWNKKR